MIIGNGLIAEKLSPEFVNNDDVCLFASGVANSSELDPSEFKREFSLLKETIINNSQRKLIYFSTTSVYSNRHSPYIFHKLAIENYIHLFCKNFLILRLPHVIGIGGNSNQIIPFFIEKLTANELITINSEEEKTLIDVEDLIKILNYFLNLNGTNVVVNIHGAETITPYSMVTQLAKLMHITSPNIEKNIRMKNYIIPNAEYVNSLKNELSSIEQDPRNILNKYYKYYL